MYHPHTVKTAHNKRGTAITRNSFQQVYGGAPNNPTNLRPESYATRNTVPLTFSAVLGCQAQSTSAALKKLPFGLLDRLPRPQTTTVRKEDNYGEPVHLHRRLMAACALPSTSASWEYASFTGASSLAGVCASAYPGMTYSAKNAAYRTGTIAERR